MINKQISYQMQLFAVVIKAGSFTLAAEQLNLTRSWLSQQINALEKSLNVQLIHRTTRSLSVTQSGERFYSRCLELTHLLELSLDEVDKSNNNIEGVIKLAAPHALIDTLVVPVVKKLISSHSGLLIELVVDDSREDLLKKNIDLSIRVGKSIDSNLKARRIGSFSEQWYCANINETPNRVITLPWQSSTQNELKVNNINSATQMAVSGLGKVKLPNVFAKKYCNSNELRPIGIANENEKVDVFSLHAYQSYTPNRVQILISELKQRFEELNG